ncbi:PRC-barrel domain-containing protein [Azospirillum soli]|uniref:PRC-barrel domain-containing protein n=1 Tax=Azospirillum soli TaxID=1304799 RepID=UPI001AE60B05|nr:PRC-barrel domain-containing protein [Azospirillum soli]MBP2314955.1 sporulation protein YlmC with PRC-barrel domain [Azospirillum soli]
MRFCVFLTLLTLSTATAFAQAPHGSPQMSALPGGWSYASLYQGWRADTMIGTEVNGLVGEELGEVVDLVISPDGRLQSVVIEASGMLDAGQARFSVPWTQLMAGSIDGTLTFPATSADVLTIIRNEPQPISRPGDWRAAALLGRPVQTEGDDGFGTVSDLIFDQIGNLQAVVVEPTSGIGGPYAQPWDAASVEPGLAAVILSTTADQVRSLGAFDTARINESVFARR